MPLDTRITPKTVKSLIIVRETGTDGLARIVPTLPTDSGANPMRPTDKKSVPYQGQVGVVHYRAAISRGGVFSQTRDGPFRWHVAAGVLY